MAYQQTQPPKTANGFALTALIVGSVAFLMGLAPVAGAVVGIAAIVLAILALVKKQNKVMAWIGLSLGTVATVTCIIFTSIIFAIAGNTAVEPAQEPAKVEVQPTPEAAPEVQEEPEPVIPAGPTDEELAAKFEGDLKFALFVEDSFQELLAVDPSMWGGYIADIRFKTGNIYVTLQVDGNAPDGKALGQQAAQALSTLMTKETVNTIGYSWVIVEDGAGIVIDQKQPKPII